MTALQRMYITLNSQLGKCCSKYILITQKIDDGSDENPKLDRSRTLMQRFFTFE